ncbi:xanthine dehydrogenase accessory factor [Actinoplanes lobatus]|uniref:Xanthine dehydrogenase accessory factor n=1 Tax=Actinoplanes lobatus TaxID=113568 RepID=A0A7W7HGR9_9ACTN|nr:XdhC/CoxI family protein [Actinoplanes lobatus]MBB4750279.1 xanthine dehydrogenase accessory factor [Actinoplanes lobatus]GGN71151.1 xanthine dehydrogenase accessory factor [Actinoplanes lobatus]GIE41927.1 xanthine dehydrogenase accessory factor [Actinoplanes lobatus]
MREIVDGLIAWRAAGVSFAVATVVNTWRSAPRRPGAAMAVNEHGDVLGSVSGGCVEGAVYTAAQEVINAKKAQTHTYGVSDGDAFEVGLTCGGTIEVMIQPDVALSSLDAVLADIAAGRPVATVSLPGAQLVVWPDRTAGTLGDPELDRIAAAQARGLLAHGRSAIATACEREVFVQSWASPARMIVFGAIDFAAAVARIGKFLGYQVTVCDARGVFATEARFPEADEVVVQWPHRYLESTEIDERTVLCVLTHDPKFDIPLLEVALRTPARYIGAMGSRRTCEDRLRRLREAGVPESALSRLRAPIGLDLGARTPEETAVAIAAEIVALSWGGSGAPLTGLTAPIHGPA